MSPIILISLTVIFFLLPDPVFAVSTSITEAPTVINQDAATLHIAISGASPGTNYLRVDIFKPDTTNYFGETFNGTEWYGGSEYKKYAAVEISQEGNWSGQLQFKVGNPNTTQYESPGEYQLRIRRYTISGNYNSSEANDNAVDIVIDVLRPTPSPQETIPSLEPPTPSSMTESSISPTMQPIHIVISEAMINPDTGDNEWVELYNNGASDAALINWFIDDVENGGGAPRQFSLTIPSKQYGVVELSSSLFNNEKDSIRLLDPNHIVIDSFEYQTSEKGKTFARTQIEFQEFCLQPPSQGIANTGCIAPSLRPTPSPVTMISPVILEPTANIMSIAEPPSKDIFPSYFPGQGIVAIPRPSSPTEEAEVLGVSAGHPPSEHATLVAPLSFLSGSFSLLSIISIVYKIKHQGP